MKIREWFERLISCKQAVGLTEADYGFVDLTPVDNADPDCSYSKALEFALSNDQIKNIALTGPYGSGKSSIIKTFETNNLGKYKFLNISLASFKADHETNIDDVSQNRLIERSILQQMLYGADSNKLLYSRFKKISPPTDPFSKSLALVALGVMSYILWRNKNVLFNPDFHTISWWGLFGLGFIVCFLTAFFISKLYKASTGISFEKISLTNAEIKTGNQSEDSILNRHLDEIIYFFQVTDYDAVVIEDLDRFENPEIFVKLREINKLINDNDQTGGNIKFLYALKDDMFVHKSRAKFFDFIIPVVPIINRSNSLEMMQKRLKNLPYEIVVNPQFLRGVSLHVDDLRLIHNTFNEFLIYYDRLKSSSLEETKLLAMMIYKNVYPNDFEKLHHGRGVFFTICRNKSTHLQEARKYLNNRIEELRGKLEQSDDEASRSVRELIDIYVGYIVSHVSGQAVVGIVCGTQHVLFNQLVAFEKFESLLSETDIKLATHQQSHPSRQISIGKSFEQIENEINPGETFLSRKKNTENKSSENRDRVQKEINELRKEIEKLPQKRLSQLIQDSEVEFDELLLTEDFQNGGVLEYLVKNGYLDDSYQLYISNFHEGRLTKHDRDFLIAIHNFHQPEINQQIDTPKEVCADMKPEDFGHKYVLNVHLMDYLLNGHPENDKRIEAAMQYISENYYQSEEFLEAYFISGKSLSSLVTALCEVWPDFAVDIVDTKNAPEIISYILRFVDEESVAERMNRKQILSDYLAEQGDLIFTSNVLAPDKYDVLKKLCVRFRLLSSMAVNESLIDYVHENNLYAITSENVNYILQKYTDKLVSDDAKMVEANYTLICAQGSDSLKEYIDDNLADYIDKVFLTLPDNSQESETAIKSLINSEKIEKHHKEKIISKQEYIFETLEGVPEELWGYVFETEKVVACWKNISEYFDSESSDSSLILGFIQSPDNFETLSKQKISNKELGESESEAISDFLLSNNEIDDSNYCKLIKCIPWVYYCFPSDVSSDKLLCLAREKRVILTKESFESAVQDNSLTAILIEKNFDDYLADIEAYPIDDDTREILLSGELSQEHKIKICHDVSVSGALDSKTLLSLMAKVLSPSNVDCSKIDTRVLSEVIINSKIVDDSIRLLIKCIPTWDESLVKGALSRLVKPYSEIAIHGKRPKLDKNDLNTQLSERLKEYGFISSVKEEKGGIRINTRMSS